MDQEHLATQESDGGSCSSAQNEQHRSCRGWFRKRRVLAAEKRKLRADCHQKVLAALTLCPPAEHYPGSFLCIGYSRKHSQWEPFSRGRNEVCDFLTVLTVIAVSLGISVVVLHGIATLYGIHGIHVW